MTRDIATIEADIQRTKEALANVKGTETEVYARIVGYYRSVRNWNKGKRDEYNLRKQFVYEGDTAYIPTEADTTCACAADIELAKPETNSFAKVSGTALTYEFYARKTCPNCPPVKEYLANSVIPGEMVDVDTEAGLAKAAEKGVLAAPTVIVYDAAGIEIARAHSVSELTAVFEPATVC